jgi:hypothetical protein
MNNSDVFKLSAGMADELTSEQQDIVAWEIKIRELETFKKRNINPTKTFNTENYHQDVGYDPEAPNLKELQLNERTKISEMSDELLEKSKRIIENTAVRIKKDDLHKTMGGGVNMLAKKYIVEDNNGHEILVNNEHIQEHFRKMYMKRMSEVTGIDYTQYDESPSDPNIDYYNPNAAEFNNTNNTDSYNTEAASKICMDEYEDD